MFIRLLFSLLAETNVLYSVESFDFWAESISDQDPVYQTTSRIHSIQPRKENRAVLDPEQTNEASGVRLSHVPSVMRLTGKS